jgi:prepilin-type N-terminal cleavage/methylation domain-containing protein
MNAPRNSRRSGFSLLELTIVILILSCVMGSVALFQMANRNSVVESATVGDAQSRAHEALERVLRELDGASLTRLIPDPTGLLGTDSIVFQKSAGVDAAGNIIWSTQTQLALAMDDGETANGLDDNQNGLVDERKLTITYDFGLAGARTDTIAHCLPALAPGELANGADDDGNGVIDEKGFNLQRLGNLLTIRLAVQARAGSGDWATWSESSQLRLRN